MRGAPGRAVVWGLLAHLPFGGMTWQVVHYLLGLEAAGFEVWYVEDTDQKMLEVSAKGWSADASENAAYVHHVLSGIGMGERWVLREPGTRRCFGSLDWSGLMSLYRDADLVLNLCGSHEIRPHHDRISSLVLVETDPGVNQVALASGVGAARDQILRHKWLVTYATNLAGEDCHLPASDANWVVSVPPVVLAQWETSQQPTRPTFTTVMNWSPPESALEWGGQRWAWSKQRTLLELTRVPSRTNAKLEIALRRADATTRGTLQDNGWTVIPASTLDAPTAYRDYIRSSRGEFSVAKEQYVAPRTGWISDRTVCYLAAGRPAVVESTQVKGIPVGVGLVDFSGVEEAAAALDDVVSNYPRHAAAARELAEEYFSADKVVARMLHDIGFGT